MEMVLAGLIRDICLDYLDDIIVMGRNFDEHLENLHKYSQGYVRQGLD